MAIIFPINPRIDDEYIYAGVKYYYTGTEWLVYEEYIKYKSSTSETNIFSKINIDNTSIFIDSNNGNMIFTDMNAGTKTLTELSSGGIPTQTNLICLPTTNIDFNVDSNFYIELSGNTTFTVINLITNIGKSGNIVVEQDLVGGWIFTLPIEFKTPMGGAVITQITIPDSISLITYHIISPTAVIINYIGNFA